MPSLEIFGKILTTSPWGQDDLHCLCVALGSFRVVQIAVLIPMWAYLYVLKWDEVDVGPPDWCEGQDNTSTRSLTVTGTSQQQSGSVVNDGGDLPWANFVETEDPKTGQKWLMSYMALSFLYSVVDLAVLVAIYSAASVGTPTNPMARGVFLRPLLRVKVVFMNLALAALVVVGILMVYFNRKSQWGCTNDSIAGEAVQGTSSVNMEDTFWYICFCILFVLQTVELLIFPCIVTNKVMAYFQTKLQSERRTVSFRERCFGTCLACLGALTCFKGGGRDVAKKDRFADVIKAMMDFMHTGGTLDVVFSDLWVAFKMLARVQRERLHSKMVRSKLDLEAASGGEAHGGVGAKSIGVGSWSGTGEGFVGEVQDERVEFLSPSVESDVALLREASHYVMHSDAIYGTFQAYLQEHSLLSKSGKEFLQTSNGVALDSIGFQGTTIMYGQFRQSGIDETPYCVLVDSKWQVLIITIRGSASLEDMVIDLQLTPQTLHPTGEQCGFEGSDQYSHKGVLTRAVWIYRDIERAGRLDKLVSDYPGYELVLTGHSLGAGCAAILAIMLRKKFPSLRCFAFCPPGGLITERLALECKDYVTSFINGADIVPRMSYENLERLLSEALEVLGRIKISKRKALQILSKHCRDEDLEYINSLLLHDKDSIPTDTTYYQQVEQFKQVRQRRKEESDLHYTPLFPPGKIVHFLRTKKRCIPRWAENTDFDEILFSPTAVSDHTTAFVIQSINNALDFFESPSSMREAENDDDNGNDDDADAFSSGSILETPTFVCCSRPHGNFVFLHGSLAFVALACSIVANNYCSFASRTANITLNGVNVTGAHSISTVFTGIGVSIGFYGFEQKVYGGSGPTNDPASYVDAGGTCVNYPDEIKLDIYMRAARGCGATSVVFGLAATVAIWFASCVTYRRLTWHIITACLFVAALFEGLTFLLFRSTLCHKLDVDAYEPLSIPATTIDSSCTMSWGAVLVVVAVVMWFLAAVSFAHYRQPISVEERLLLWLGGKRTSVQARRDA